MRKLVRLPSEQLPVAHTSYRRAEDATVPCGDTSPAVIAQRAMRDFSPAPNR
jgi:hypothetical protein